MYLPVAKNRTRRLLDANRSSGGIACLITVSVFDIRGLMSSSNFSNDDSSCAGNSCNLTSFNLNSCKSVLYTPFSCRFAIHSLVQTNLFFILHFCRIYQDQNN